MRKHVIMDGAGCPESELLAAEKRMGQPLPDDVREFYRAARPVDNINGSAVWLNLYDVDTLHWQPMSVWQEQPPEDWADAQGLLFGCMAAYHSGLYWIRGHRRHPDGCIVLVDPEEGLRNYVRRHLNLSVLARSLKEFLAKVVAIDGLVPGFEEDEDDPETWAGGEKYAENTRRHVEAARLFSAEYAELNPASETH